MARSHSLTVPSASLLASVRLSGLYATEYACLVPPAKGKDSGTFSVLSRREARSYPRCMWYAARSSWAASGVSLVPYKRPSATVSL